MQLYVTIYCHLVTWLIINSTLEYLDSSLSIIMTDAYLFIYLFIYTYVY